MVCNNYSQNPSSMNDMHSSAPPKQTPTMDHGTAFNFWETLAAHCWTKTPPVQSVLHGAESWAPHDGGCRFRLPKHPGFARVPTRDTMPTRGIGTSSPARRCFAQGQPWWLMPNCWEKKHEVRVGLQIICHSVGKLDSCVRGVSLLHQEYQMKVYQVSPRFDFCWFRSLQVELLGNTPLLKKRQNNLTKYEERKLNQWQ